MTTTASASSSSGASRSLDLAALGLLPSLPAAFAAGRDLDLLAPLRLASGRELPATAAGADRAPLAAALAEANAAYGHPRAAELGELLADPATTVVVTGQQPGLFGGPLYTVSKAVAAVLWAERLRASGRAAVAVFWMATEDHDFRESSWATFQLPDGPRRFDLGDDPQPLAPLGVRTLGDRVGNVLEELRTALPAERFTAWCDTLARWYQPSARFGEAFARLLTHLLGERCPLILDAMLPAAKAGQRPALERCVERRAEVDAALTAASAAVADRGHPHQVAPQPGASPLFFLHGGERRKIIWEGSDEWSLRGADGRRRPVAELEAAIADNPAVVMPGVLVRPVVQDALLGTSLQVVGPGELSYLPQLAPLYDVLEVTPPAVALRPQALVLPSHQERKLAEAEVDLEALVVGDVDVDATVAGAETASRLGEVRRAADRLLAALEQAADGGGQEMESALSKTRSQVERGLEQFEGRMTSALAREAAVRKGRLERLAQWVRPLGELQERVLSTADLPGRYGDRFVDALFEQLGVDGERLSVIDL